MLNISRYIQLERHSGELVQESDENILFQIEYKVGKNTSSECEQGRLGTRVGFTTHTTQTMSYLRLFVCLLCGLP